MTRPKTKPTPKGKGKAGTRPESPPVPVPPGTEVMLFTREAAAALGLRPARFGQLVNQGKVPQADGVCDWNGYRFWKQSTINRYINTLVEKGVDGAET